MRWLRLCAFPLVVAVGCGSDNTSTGSTTGMSSTSAASSGAASGTGGSNTSTTTSVTASGTGGGASTASATSSSTGAGTGGGTSTTSATSSNAASGTGGSNTVWANWPMPNPASAGLPNPASYDTSTPGVVRDEVTGLLWQQIVDPGTYTWDQATAYCEGLMLAGHSDWRVPTRIELVSLVDYTVAPPGPTIDIIAFPNTPSNLFWTSSAWASGNPGGWWYVNFVDGDASTIVGSFTSRVRCVR